MKESYEEEKIALLTLIAACMCAGRGLEGLATCLYIKVLFDVACALLAAIKEILSDRLKKKTNKTP